MIKNALLSVSDKTGIVDFAKGLVDLGVTIYSTGGTLKAITEASILPSCSPRSYVRSRRRR